MTRSARGTDIGVGGLLAYAGPGQAGKAKAEGEVCEGRGSGRKAGPPGRSRAGAASEDAAGGENRPVLDRGDPDRLGGARRLDHEALAHVHADVLGPGGGAATEDQVTGL